MAVVNERAVTGRKFRKLIDEANRLWLRISFWTMACDVEFADEETAETKFSNMANTINNLIKSFQDGVNKIFEKLKGLGFTPNPNSPDGICNAIQNMYNKRYNDGRTQGQEDVKANPNAYGVSTSAKYAQTCVGGTLVYTCPTTGNYNITALYQMKNDNSHHNLGNDVELHIGDETIQIYHYSPSSGEESGIGNQTLIRNLQAGTIISLVVSDQHIGESDCIFTVGTLVVS